MIFKDILGMALISLGMLFFMVEILGVYRFDYVLNRMHAVAIGDSIALLLSLTGAGLLMWDWFAAAKLFITLLLVWITSPVGSHLVARVEAMTNNHLDSYLDKPITEKNHTLKGDPYGKN